jgi:hypothetical protein
MPSITAQGMLSTILMFNIRSCLQLILGSGVAQAAVHSVNFACFFEESGLPKSTPSVGKSPTLLSLLRQVYDADILTPDLPYDPDALLSERRRRFLADPARPVLIRRIYDSWTFNEKRGDAEIQEKIDECIWQATLLLASTGLKEGKKPRADFFLMHVLTSALFLPGVVGALTTFRAKERLLQAYVRQTAMYIMLRGRPRIDIPRLMAYPAVASRNVNPHSTALGTPLEPETRNPWMEIIQDALHHPEPHVIKSVRTLYYAATRYGQTAPGRAPGAYDESGQETHAGSGKMDGSIFTKAAVLVMDTLGWVTKGQEAKDWDRSALGWDDAWKTDI